MSKNIKKILKEKMNHLFETKGFEDMEVAFGVKGKSDNLDSERSWPIWFNGNGGRLF